MERVLKIRDSREEDASIAPDNKIEHNLQGSQKRSEMRPPPLNREMRTWRRRRDVSHLLIRTKQASQRAKPPRVVIGRNHDFCDSDAPRARVKGWAESA